MGLGPDRDPLSGLGIGHRRMMVLNCFCRGSVPTSRARTRAWLQPHRGQLFLRPAVDPWPAAAGVERTGGVREITRSAFGPRRKATWSSSAVRAAARRQPR